MRPKSWIVRLVVGIAFGCAFKLLMKAIVMPLLGVSPINEAYHYLVGNNAGLRRRNRFSRLDVRTLRQAFRTEGVGQDIYRIAAAARMICVRSNAGAP